MTFNPFDPLSDPDEYDGPGAGVWIAAALLMAFVIVVLGGTLAVMKP